MATQDSPSLYERLGGVYSIATVVDDLIDRVMADPRLNANPLVDDAHHKVPPAGFKYLVTEMLCWAAGRLLTTIHKPLFMHRKTYSALLTRLRQIEAKPDSRAYKSKCLTERTLKPASMYQVEWRPSLTSRAKCDLGLDFDL